MSNGLQVTALHPVHKELKAQIIAFAGWEMPAQYGSAVQEHHAVRGRAGMFDVSHMGRLYIKGRDAQSLLDHVLTADVKALAMSQAKYCMACNHQGGILDDLIVYCLEPDHYLVVCNAANRQMVVDQLDKNASRFGKVLIKDGTMETAMVALQGPKALEALGAVSPITLNDVPAPFRSAEVEMLGQKALVARTGYTGEDGVEIIVSSHIAPTLWKKLYSWGVTPCGLIARDSLRLEAGLRLYGNDMDTSVNPYEAGLGRFVELEKEVDFIGKVSIKKVKEQGVSRKLAGFHMIGRGVPRHEFPILYDGKQVGHVTSGGHSPTLNLNLGLGFLPVELAQKDTHILIDIRGRQIEAKVVSLPFYRRS